MRAKRLSLLTQGGLVCVLVFLVGCVTAQVKSANSALEAARAAGKDKECPADFQAAENMVRQAESLCKVCKPEEANALARDAEAKISGLCPAAPRPAAAPAPAPPPEAVRVPAPTASLSASPAKVEAGGCSTLSWTTTNATSVSIDGVGTVDASGSKTVCPSSTMTYTLRATGTGGTGSDSASVEVAAKAAPAARLTIHVNFDTDKSVIRKPDVAELQKAEEFVKKYPTCKIEVGGYTDSRGTEQYNQGLSERRANSVKKWLIDHAAVAGDHIEAKGYGESNPVGDNGTEKGRFENRRAEILIFCQ